MEVTAWKSGAFGNQHLTFGIRVGPHNRSKYFRRGWQSVAIQFQGGATIEVPITDGFWSHCPELRHAAIGGWLQAQALIPWPPRNPPTLVLTPLGGRTFHLKS
jgi:hypothetical protein